MESSNQSFSGLGMPMSILGGVGWIVTVSIALLLTNSLLTAIYNIYFHPLRHFPGPWFAAASRWPFVLRLLNGRMVPWTTQLHAQYGEVVRILPDELSFITGSAWTDIYTSRPQLPKPKVGTIVSANGVRSIATIVHTPDHTRQRRILGHAFSDRALKQQEYILHNYANMLVTQLRRFAADKEEVDICDWYNFATFDIIADLCFGEPFDSLRTGQHHEWVKTTFASLKIAQILSAFTLFPPLDRSLEYLLPSAVMRKAKRHFQYTVDQIDKRIAKNSERPDIMKFILENNSENGMTKDEIDATVQLVVLAGSETSATTMTGVTWFALHNPSVWERLSKEVRDAWKKYDDIDVASASKLPFLHACIQETLRLHPPAPVSVPREVDRSGVVIAGRSVPMKTRVGISQRTAYHSNSNFVNPESFVPERWLPEADPIYADDNKAAYEPFMVGPRNCIGKTLAWAEMKLILSKVIWTFNLKLSSNNVEDWSDQRVFLLHEKVALNVLPEESGLP